MNRCKLIAAAAIGWLAGAFGGQLVNPGFEEPTMDGTVPGWTWSCDEEKHSVSWNYTPPDTTPPELVKIVFDGAEMYGYGPGGALTVASNGASAFLDRVEWSGDESASADEKALQEEKSAYDPGFVAFMETYGDIDPATATAGDYLAALARETGKRGGGRRRPDYRRRGAESGAFRRRRAHVTVHERLSVYLISSTVP